MGTRRSDSTRLPAVAAAAIYGCRVNPDDVEPLVLGDGEPEPLDPNELSFVQFAHSEDSEDTPQPTMRTWYFVVAATVVVVVGMVLGIIVFNSSTPDSARGAASAKAAADEFVAAVNAGNSKAAAAISCDTFADDARSAAQSGKDPSVRYTVDSVGNQDKTSATAVVTEHLTLPGSTQTKSYNISVLRSSGRWLMCGRTS